MFIYHLYKLFQRKKNREIKASKIDNNSNNKTEVKRKAGTHRDNEILSK